MKILTLGLILGLIIIAIQDQRELKELRKIAALHTASIENLNYSVSNHTYWLPRYLGRIMDWSTSTTNSGPITNDYGNSHRTNGVTFK